MKDIKNEERMEAQEKTKISNFTKIGDYYYPKHLKKHYYPDYLSDNYCLVDDIKIEEKMEAERKTKILNFNKMVANHFIEKYNLDGYFKYFKVGYTYFNRFDRYLFTCKYLPFFIEKGTSINERCFLLDLGEIEVYNLNFEICKRLPKGIRLITGEEISELLLNNGYEEPFFEFYSDESMKFPNYKIYYNLYARSIVKDKGLSRNIMK